MLVMKRSTSELARGHSGVIRLWWSRHVLSICRNHHCWMEDHYRSWVHPEFRTCWAVHRQLVSRWLQPWSALFGWQDNVGIHQSVIRRTRLKVRMAPWSWQLLPTMDLEGAQTCAKVPGQDPVQCPDMGYTASQSFSHLINARKPDLLT